MSVVTVEGWILGSVVGLVAGLGLGWLGFRRLGVGSREALLQRLQRTADALDEVVETAPAGFVVLGTDGRVVRINPAMARILGTEPAEALGRSTAEVFGADAAGVVADAVRRVRETGGAVADVRLGLTTATETHRTLLVSCYPVEIEDITMVGVVAVDITDRERYDREREELLASESEARERAERAASRLARLQAITSALSTAPSSRLVSEVIMAEGMKAMEVDAGALAVISEDLRGLRVVATDRWRAATGDGVEALGFDAPHPVARAARARRSAYFESTEEMDDASPDLAAAARAGGWKSFAALPLLVSDRVLGALGAAFGDARAFDPERVAFLESVADQCAAALDRALTYDATQVLARTLQQSLLPPSLPDIREIDVAARFEPAGNGEVSGDFYDVFGMPGGTWCVAIGDVCGKGADAATMTSLARHTIRAVAYHDHRPSAVLGELSEALRRDIEERGRGDDDAFCTAAFAFLRPVAGGVAVDLTCGGHPLPLVVRRGGLVEECGTPGTFLGALEPSEMTLVDQVVILEPGDALVFYTDGVTEAAGPDGFFGEDRLRIGLGGGAVHAEALAARVTEQAMDFSNGVLRDDLAIVVVRVPEHDGVSPGAVTGSPR